MHTGHTRRLLLCCVVSLFRYESMSFHLNAIFTIELSTQKRSHPDDYDDNIEACSTKTHVSYLFVERYEFTTLAAAKACT